MCDITWGKKIIILPCGEESSMASVKSSGFLSKEGLKRIKRKCGKKGTRVSDHQLKE